MGIGPLSLMGTLQGGLASAEAEQEQARQALAAQAEAASRAATGAQGALQQAVQAPMPDVNPMAALIQSLGGDIGSIIGETPAYRERAQKDLGDERMSLLAARSQNLKMLQDNYDRQAQAASSAGDLLAEAKLRASSEKVAKANALIMEQVHHQNATDLQAQKSKADASEGALDRASREKIAGMAAARSAPGADLSGFDPSQYVTTTAPSDAAPNGRQFVDLSVLAGKQKDAATAWANKNGIMALSALDATAVKDVSRARLDMLSLNDYIQGLLPADAATRTKKYLNMKVSKLLQTNEQRAAFQTWRDTAIPTLRAMAGSRGLRISQQQIQLMVNNLPKDDDTYGTAMRKLKTINTLITNAETPLVTRNWGQVKASGTGTTGSGAKAAVRVRVGIPGKATYEIDATDVPQVLKDNPGFVRMR